MGKIITVSPSSYSISRTHYNNFQEPSIIDELESRKSLKEIKQIHSYVIKTSPMLSHQTQQLMYARIISISSRASQDTVDMTYLHTVFGKLENLGIDIYNTVIRSFIDKSRNPQMALLVYSDLIGRSLVGDSFTYPFVLKACTLLCALREGEQIHGHVVKNGSVVNLYVVNTLMRFYSGCGLTECAQKVFDGSSERDLVSWTTLIQGYVEMGLLEKGVAVFDEMCEAGVRPDEITMVILVSACARMGDLNLGRKLHEYMRLHGLNFDVYMDNALVDMYMKCGDASLALKVFDEMPMKNLVSWNSMVSGLVQQGEFRRALNVFRAMQNEGVKHDHITLVAVLNCCANLGLLEQGKWVHAYMRMNDIRTDGYVGNALLDMYSKCGHIDKAHFIFNDMKDRDVYTYTSMIVGLAMHGEGQSALEVFSKMPIIGVAPNGVTYVGILMACAHAGLVKEGCKHFVDMLTVHNIKPQKEHYGCMVDLLCRAGLLSDAEDFIQHMHIEPDALAWGALQAACRIHGDVEIGERVMERVVKMEAEQDGPYILMSNLYSSLNRWRDAVKIRKTMKERKIKKRPGCSSIEVDGMMYEFRKGDKSHIRSNEIYTLLDAMGKHLKNRAAV